MINEYHEKIREMKWVLYGLRSPCCTTAWRVYHGHQCVNQLYILKLHNFSWTISMTLRYCKSPVALPRSKCRIIHRRWAYLWHFPVDFKQIDLAVVHCVSFLSNSYCIVQRLGDEWITSHFLLKCISHSVDIINAWPNAANWINTCFNNQLIHILDLCEVGNADHHKRYDT